MNLTLDCTFQRLSFFLPGVQGAAESQFAFQTGEGWKMRGKFMAGVAVTTMLMLAARAQAGRITIVFSGHGLSGSLRVTTSPNVAPADPNPMCGTPGNHPCRTDPASAYAITRISGTFSDPAAGIVNAVITGLVPIAPANERDPRFDPLLPSSLSFVDYGQGASAGNLSYDNLFYPGGSPVVCKPYPFSGTLLDIYGVAFTVQGGYTVVLWGVGNVPGVGLTYGVGVTQGMTRLAFFGTGVTATTRKP